MPPDIGDSCIGLQGKLLLDCHNSQAPNCIRLLHADSILHSIGTISTKLWHSFQLQFQNWHCFQVQFSGAISKTFSIRTIINQSLAFFLAAILELALFSAKIKCNSNTLLIGKYQPNFDISKLQFKNFTIFYYNFEMIFPQIQFQTHFQCKLKKTFLIPKAQYQPNAFFVQSILIGQYHPNFCILCFQLQFQTENYNAKLF